MKVIYLVLFVALILLGCKTEKEMSFSDFVDVDKIEKVKVKNDSVTFYLSKDQLKEFKEDLASLEYAPNTSTKTGVVILKVTVEGKDYDVSSSENNDYIRIDKSLVTNNKTSFKNEFFSIEGLNLDEYKPENKLKLYAVSGLGVDSRVFEGLELDHCELIPLEWIDPHENESIESYSMRLSEPIDQSEEFGILGVSFGGLVATEISQKLNPKLTVLVSTAETKDGLTSLFKLIGRFNLNDYLSTKMYDPPRRLSYFMFGTDNKDELDAILDDSDLSFTKWAVEELVNWENETKLETVIHISGTEDRILPPTESENLHLIEGGGHFMIVDKAQEVSEVINDFIKANQ
ncbi:MAG: alpha/beta hydrolase [Brumimicrobium sp.]